MRERLGEEIFEEIIKERFPYPAAKVAASRSIGSSSFGRIMRRAVTGDLRSFVYACNYMQELSSVGYPELTQCMLYLSGNYFWPLLEEVAPKLGTYEILVGPAQEVAQFLFLACAKKSVSYSMVHRDIMQRHSKIFEILEYAGFMSRRDASRALKSGGRGVVFSMNLCNLLEVLPGSRLTSDLAEQWTKGTDEPFELHVTNPEFSRLEIPDATPGEDLSILQKPISHLRLSNAYPYGLTDDKVTRLEGAGLSRIVDVAQAPDEQILDIAFIGPKSLKRIRDVVYQAIWM